MWPWQGQRRLQQDLARGVVRQIFTTHHMSDALRRIVDHHRQLVGVTAVRTLEHKVTHFGADVLLLCPQTPVMPRSPCVDRSWSG
jgi:hypothetical protein